MDQSLDQSWLLGNDHVAAGLSAVNIGGLKRSSGCRPRSQPYVVSQEFTRRMMMTSDLEIDYGMGAVFFSCEITDPTE